MNTFPYIVKGQLKNGIPETPGYYGFPNREPQKLGTIVTDTFSSLKDWTQVGGGTFTPSGAGLSVSGGTTNYTTNYIKYAPLPNSFEQWKMSMEFTPTISGSGILIGIHSIMNDSFSTLNRSFYGRWASTATHFGAYIITFYEGTGTTATAAATTAVDAAYTLGVDDIRLEFERNKDLYTVTCTNLMTGVSRSSSYTAKNANTVVPNNAGLFCIHALGGSQTVKHIKVTSDCQKNARAVFVGDSITHGLDANLLVGRYSDRVFRALSGSGRHEVFAGGNDRTLCYTNTTGLEMLSPDYVFMAIGTNDLAGGVSESTYKANYTTIRNNMVSAGSSIVHLATIPRDTVDVRPFNAWKRATFPQDIYIDTYTPLATSSSTYTLRASLTTDGVHPNDTGHVIYANTIRNAMPYL